MTVTEENTEETTVKSSDEQQAATTPVESTGVEEVKVSEGEAEQVKVEQAEKVEKAEGDSDLNENEKGSAAVMESEEEDSNVSHELHQLVDFCTKYPDIAPTIARLAAKLGYQKITERVVRLGLEREDSPIEFYFVAARLAREEGRYEDVLNTVLEALRSVVENLRKGVTIPTADRTRLLHVIRLGFATLMFNFDDIRSKPEFSNELCELIKELEPEFKEDPFFQQLYAQALWFIDNEASENQWEQAVKLGEPEDVWNARGTWYKEASQNITAAEAAYRRGLEKTADSALLMHNLAQVLMDRAEASIRIDIPQSAVLLNEAEGFLRKAKRFAHRQAMRTHVFENFDRLRKLKTSLDTTVTPEVGDVVTGRVISLKNYGAFIVLPSGHTGLLHSSEMDHYWVEDATTRYNENDPIQVKIIKIEDRQDGEGLRISLSRKVLIDKPADFDESLAKPPSRRKESKDGESRGGRRGDRREGGRRNNRGDRGERREGGRRGGHRNGGGNPPQQYRDSGAGATIADILSAKLNLQNKDNE